MDGVRQHRLLVDGAGLELDEVHTTLNALDDQDPGWWALGKLLAYRAQTDGFVHIDSDVFLWTRLRRNLESAPVVAQNPEYFVPGRSFYQPEVVEAAVWGVADGWLPPEWHWYRQSGMDQRGESCGVMGGQRLDFIHHYADRAIDPARRPVGHRGHRRLPSRSVPPTTSSTAPPTTGYGMAPSRRSRGSCCP